MIIQNSSKTMYTISKRFCSNLNNFKNSFLQHNNNFHLCFKKDNLFLHSIPVNDKTLLKLSDIIQLKYGSEAKKIMEDIVFIKTISGIQYVPEIFHDSPLYNGGTDCDNTYVVLRTQKYKHISMTQDQDSEFLLNGAFLLNPNLVDLEQLIYQYGLDINDVRFIHGSTKWDLKNFVQDLFPYYHSQLWLDQDGDDIEYIDT